MPWVGRSFRKLPRDVLDSLGKSLPRESQMPELFPLWLCHLVDQWHQTEWAFESFLECLVASDVCGCVLCCGSCALVTALHGGHRGQPRENSCLAMAGSASEGSLTLCAIRAICLELDFLLQTTFTSEVKLHAQQFPLNRGTFPLAKLHVAARVFALQCNYLFPYSCFFVLN